MLPDFFLNKESNYCYVIAEIGLNHNGSMEISKKLIDVAVECNVDAVKFQKRTVSKLTTNELLDASDNRFPEFGKTYREIRDHMEFDKEQYIELKEYTKNKSLDFIVTAFDQDAVDFLEEIDLGIYKLASHSLTNIDLLEYIAKTKKPVILSTGMCDLDEIKTAAGIFKKHDSNLVLLHCVSAYPTPIEQSNLKMINLLKKEFDLPIGYSGHEIGFLPTLTAVSMGAVAVERHITLDKNMMGFDHKISLEPNDLKEMVEGIRNIEKIKGISDKTISETEMLTRNKYHVSMVSNVEIPQGTIIKKDMITYKNPGTGIPAKKENLVIGKTTKFNIPEDQLLSFDMFE